jgi:hypothetical protein
MSSASSQGVAAPQEIFTSDDTGQRMRAQSSAPRPANDPLVVTLSEMPRAPQASASPGRPSQRRGSPRVDGITSIGGEERESMARITSCSARRLGGAAGREARASSEWVAHIGQRRLHSSGLVMKVIRHGEGSTPASYSRIG